MGMLDRPTPNRVWKFSFCAKAEGFLSAELQVASSGQSEKKGFLSFFTNRRRSYSNKSRSYRQEERMCDVSLCIRARLFFLKARVAAGRLCELRLQTRQGSSKKLTMLDFKSSLQSSVTSPLPSSHIFKESPSSPSSERSSSFLRRILFAKKKRKESLYVCGAGLGAFAVLLLHHASAWATYLPSFALNAGSYLVSFLVKFVPSFALNAGSYLVSFLVKIVHKKRDTAGSKGDAWVWQGFGRAASLFKQMATLLIRPMFVGNRFVTTALIAVLIGVIMTGKAGKLQDFLDRKKQGGARLLRARIAMKVLLVIRLLQRCWAHIGMKQAFLFVLLLAFLSSAVSQLQTFS